MSLRVLNGREPCGVSTELILGMWRLRSELPREMTFLAQTIQPFVDDFGSATQIEQIASSPDVFRLTVSDPPSLTKTLAECIKTLEGVKWYDENAEYQRLCEAAGLSRDSLFVPRATASRSHLDKVQMGDLGELIGCLTLAAHFGLDPNALFARNLAKPSALRSESGYDIAVIRLDFSDESSVALGPADEFRAVESKASRTNDAVSLTRNAANTVERDIQEVQKLLQLYKHLADERFASQPATARIPSFLVEFATRGHRFRFCCVAATPTELPEDAATTVKAHLASLHSASAILCKVDISQLLSAAYTFREQAS